VSAVLSDVYDVGALLADWLDLRFLNVVFAAKALLANYTLVVVILILLAIFTV